MTDKELMKQAFNALEEIHPTNVKPVAWLHRMDNTEGIKSNGKGIVLIDQYRRHPFGKAGVDFDKSYPVTSTPLYTSAQPQKPWVGLTPEDYDSMRPRVPYTVNDFALADVAAIVEAKLKEKNYERRTF